MSRSSEPRLCRKCGKEHHRNGPLCDGCHNASIKAKSRTCPDCHRAHSRRTRRCSTCHNRMNLSDPVAGAVRRARRRETQRKWVADHPEQRSRHAYTYATKTSRIIPLEVHELRVAIKRIDRAVVAAENGTPIHEPSKRRCNASAERRSRFGNSEDVQRDSADHRADRDGRGSAGARKPQRARSRIRGL